MIGHNVMINIKTAGDTKGAVAVENSIESIEKELRNLQQSLRTLPVGSDQFNAMAGQVAAAEIRLNGAQQAAKNLGATVGRSGNAGMAMLEFSRLTEDAQYGLRGILNNIPTLIMQLGGTAGLAGVISIAAVAASQLWERFAQSPNTESIDEMTERAKNLRDRFLEAAQAAIEARGDKAGDAAEKLGRAFKDIDRKSGLEQNKLGLEAARLDAEKRKEIQEQIYRLALLEMGILIDGQKSSLSLAEQRLAIEQEIEGINARAVEQKRQQEEAAAAERVRMAERKLPGATDEKNALGGELGSLQTRLATALERLAAQDERTRTASSSLQSAQKALDENIDPESSERLLATRNAAKADLSTERELYANMDASVKSLREQVDAAALLYKDSSQALVDLRTAAKDAATALSDVRQRNEFDRGAERVERENKTAFDTVKVKNEVTVDELQDIAAKANGNAELKPVVAAIQEALKDGTVTLEEMNNITLLLAQNNRQLRELGGDINKQLEEAFRVMDDLRRSINQLKMNAPAADPRTSK